MVDTAVVGGVGVRGVRRVRGEVSPVEKLCGQRRGEVDGWRSGLARRWVSVERVEVDSDDEESVPYDQGGRHGRTR